jgi:hypothetical protein
LTLILPSHYGPGVDSASNRKNTRRPIFLKSRILNLLEPSGRVKGCNGVALPLLYPVLIGTGKQRAKVSDWSN